MKKLILLHLVCLAAVMITVGVQPAKAAANVVAIEGMSYNVKASLHDNLKAMEGKYVFITLTSGTVLSGTIKAVGEHLVHLEKLDSKDFFDALIRIEEICAVDAKFRDFQR